MCTDFIIVMRLLTYHPTEFSGFSISGLLSPDARCLHEKSVSFFYVRIAQQLHTTISVITLEALLAFPSHKVKTEHFMHGMPFRAPYICTGTANKIA